MDVHLDIAVHSALYLQDVSSKGIILISLDLVVQTSGLAVLTLLLITVRILINID
jgi:hypothetical protein